jgi:two-component system, LytTR family, response regulator
MKHPIRCLIIDDEPPARELLLHYLARIPDVEVCGTCANGFDALKAIREFSPDLLLLDIQMPKISGFELLELLDDPPSVIFCTAYDEFAIKAFEMHAVDYLLKPFSEDRLRQALDRAIARIHDSVESPGIVYDTIAAQTIPKSRQPERIIVKSGTVVTVIPLEAIHYLEAQDDYVLVVSDLGEHLKEKTMKYYEGWLPGDTFVRIHRSYIVNINRIRKVSLYGKESYSVLLTTGSAIRASVAGYKLLREMF